MSARRILVVGADSLVGMALIAHLRGAGMQVLGTTRRPETAAPDRLLLDLADARSIAALALPELDGAVVAAARARVFECARDPAGSRRVNVDGAAAMAGRLRRHGAQVIFLSSDKVFDGALPHRRRDDATCPTTEYGRQKAAAEAALLESGGDVAVLRLSKVLSPALELLRGWAAALTAGRPIMPFHDMTLAPVAVADVCRLLERLLLERATGLYQLSGDEDRSYLAMAKVLARTLGVDAALVRPVACDPVAHPPEARPPHTTLDMSVERARFGFAPPRFEETVARTCAMLPGATAA